VTNPVCLILFAYQSHARFRLIMAANRDEYYERPTQALQFWSDDPDIAAGRDLKEMGTWLGITRKGRLAAVTNYREVGFKKHGAPSRGDLVVDFLVGNMPPGVYSEKLQRVGDRYNGFNLIFGDTNGLHYFSNRCRCLSQPIAPGIYGLSNRLLDSDWPKVRNGKSRLATILGQDDDAQFRLHLWELLKNQEPAPEAELPETGVGRGWERILAPIFITSSTYGTRSSSLLTLSYDGEVEFSEITWSPAKAQPNVKIQNQLCFKIEK
jgi:uncharacterized protein with NRDE domain